MRRGAIASSLLAYTRRRGRMEIFMEVMLCKGCGRLFNSSYGEEYCNECQNLPDTDFKKVREYLWEHPNTPAETVAKACGVPLKTVMHYVKQQRLEISKDSMMLLKCENCGKSILSGTYCRDCESKLMNKYSRSSQSKSSSNKNLSGSVGKNSVKDDGKMRYL